MPLTIYPYLLGGTCWVFDDERTALKEEAFVLGMSEMITRAVEQKHIPNPADGFTLVFDDAPFNHDVELKRISTEERAPANSGILEKQALTGTWYRGDVFGQEMTGWLCPALFLYFNKAPETIYAKVQPLPAGVNPIWQVLRNDPGTRRFMSASNEPLS